MVWEPKRAKGADSAELARASERHLALYVAALAEDIAGIALL